MANNLDDIFSAKTAEKQSKASSSHSKPYNKDSWAEDKQLEREQVYKLIDDTAEQVVSDEQRFKEFLDASARLNLYSTGNTLLILAQKPSAIRLADFEKWKEEGAYVNKGEKGINILEPGEEYTRDDGTVGISYNVKKVFDITQTSADQKPQIVVNRDDRILLKALMALSPVPISTSDSLNGNTHALYKPQEKIILVQKGMDAQNIFRALSLEIAHARMAGGSYNRNDFAFCACAVSYILSKRNGIDISDYNFSNISERYSGLETKDIREDLSLVRSVSDEMIRDMDKSLNPPHKSQSKNSPSR